MEPERTFIKKNTAPPVIEKRRRFAVWIVVRHTRAGDERKHVIDKGKQPERTREYALGLAEDIANDAAMAYGYGSASVFSGTLTMANEPERPKAKG